jgi:D-glycero-alpha-D-manno-heptose-7-phosphate kinase
MTGTLNHDPLGEAPAAAFDETSRPAVFGARPWQSMVISRTPFRISFFGGGTDYPEWYRQHGGAVLSTAIDKYCYIFCRYLPPFFSIKHRIVWSHIELVQSIREILHPAVRGGLQMLGFEDKEGLEIHHQADLPARTGIGSSSSFAVGLISALWGLRGQAIDKQDLFYKAIELERNWLKEAVGSQDQVAAAVGGLNVIRFRESGEIVVEPLRIAGTRRNALNNRLMMFYTGTSRLGTDIASDIAATVGKRQAVLERMHKMVDEAAGILRNGSDLDDFGRLLHESWELKKRLSDRITNSGVDAIYDAARAHGAIGGKLLGAGSSGFMVFYVPLAQRSKLRRALGHLLEVPFRFATNGCTLLQNRSERRGS